MYDELINVLNDGKLVLIPTDTVYGISGDATNIDAIKRVYELKKRDVNKPLIVLVSSYDMLCNYVSNISLLDKKLIDKFWPGALTIIFNNDKFPKENTGGLNTIGIRCPNDEFLLSLIEEYGKPIFSTSANISGNDVIKEIRDLDSSFLEKIDYVLDKGYINNKASTIVSTLDGNIKILREGDLAMEIKKTC